MTTSDTLELYVDPAREQRPATGIFVRAIRVNGDARRYDNADIAHLDYNSLLRWLRSRNGMNEGAEQIVALILGHNVKRNVD